VPGGEERISATLVPQYDRVAPGQSFHVAVDIRLAEGWAYYSPVPGKSYDFQPLPAKLSVSPGALKAGEPLWPPDKPYVYEVPGTGSTPARRYENAAYKGREIVYVPVSVPADAPRGRQRIAVQLDGQICHGKRGICVSLDAVGTQFAIASVEVAEAARLNPAWEADDNFGQGIAAARTVEQIAAARSKVQAEPAGLRAADRTLVGGMALALLAGLILNIMPCVLPVVPLRIYSVMQMAGGSRRRFVTLGLAFAGGIVLFFVGMAVVNIIVKLSVGRALNWSEQWQSEGVRIGMSLVLVAVAANLFGLFTVTVPRKVAALEARERRQRRGHVSSAGFGLMMAVLATPCSFGILLAALGWAQTQTLAVGTLVFLLIGLGMAGPHVLLAAFPSLVEKLPRPGRWMELFKQSMGFALLLVAVWLLSTLAPSEKGAYAFWAAGFCVMLSFALWMWGTWVRYDWPLSRKLIVRALAAIFAVACGFYMLRPSAPPAINFEPFDEARIDEARQAGRIVLVKFTATWCLSCKVVEATVYEDQEVADKTRRLNVLPMKGDVSNAGMPARDLLYARLHKAPPLTAVYLPGRDEPRLLEGEFGKSELLEILDSASGRR
jgi:thiol:disulfide interchange protein DsbD